MRQIRPRKNFRVETSWRAKNIANIRARRKNEKLSFPELDVSEAKHERIGRLRFERIRKHYNTMEVEARTRITSLRLTRDSLADSIKYLSQQTNRKEDEIHRKQIELDKVKDELNIAIKQWRDYERNFLANVPKLEKRYRKSE